MDLFQAMGISASGLRAQRSVIDSISMNLAHVHTTGPQGREPYRKMQARLSPMDPIHRFPDLLSNQIILASHLHRTHRTIFPDPSSKKST
jgi:flagellar basal body rod protein FlgC